MSSSKHKLYDYAVPPPPGLWEKIAVELDDIPVSSTFSNKLYHAEVTPPAGTWNKILASLQEEAPVQRQAKVFPFLRYAVAAAVIAFLAWGAFRFLDDRNTSDSPVVTNNNSQQVTPVIKTDTTQTAPEKINDVAVITDDSEKRNDVALEASKKTYAKLSVPSRTKIKNAADFHFSLDHVEPVEDAYADPATRYIVLMTPDGNIIRMSKKWSDLVCCVSGEEQDAACIDQMKKWRDKLATSSAAHSPGNFGDILSLVKSLQE